VNPLDSQGGAAVVSNCRFAADTIRRPDERGIWAQRYQGSQIFWINTVLLTYTKGIRCKTSRCSWKRALGPAAASQECCGGALLRACRLSLADCEWCP